MTTNVHLTEDEQKILMGENGEGKRYAMERLLDIGEVYSASKLVRISSAHVSGVSYLAGGEALIEQLRSFVERGCKVSVPCFLNPCGADLEKWKEMDIDEAFAQKQKEIIDMYKLLGVIPTCSCIPYDIGSLSMKGEHLAWAESSAVVFANSFFGARTNKEDSVSALAAAIIGKTSFYGLHLTRNRIPNMLVNVKAKMTSATDFSLLGYEIGKRFSERNVDLAPLPVFDGINRVRPYHVKLLSASIATSGAIYMFHIKGITPEQELISLDEITERLTVTERDLEQFYADFAPVQNPDLVIIGCPHTSIEGFMKIAQHLKKRKVRENVDLWIFTSRGIMEFAESAGYVDAIVTSGGKVFCDTCPVLMPLNKRKHKYIVTNSAKAAHYLSAPHLNGVPAAVLPLRTCIGLACGEDKVQI
jgi:predicted aconitase